MTTLDWVVVAAYFLMLLALTWWSLRKNRKTADDYFLAGRNLGWVIVGASIFASNIGSEHLVGLAGAGATSGVALAHYELHAWCLLVLGWVLVPFYMRSRVYTTPEFLERRFSPAARWVFSLISLVAYVLTKIAVGIFAGGVVFATLLPDMQLTMGGTVFNSFWVGSVLVVVLTGLYTVIGGMRAVAYTEAAQTGVFVLGSLMLSIFGLRALGGWGELRRVLGSEAFNLWKPLIPAGVEGTWAPVIEPGRMAWYFNAELPVDRDALLRADRRALVLVHRSVHRAAHARRTQRARGPSRHDLRGVPQAPAGVHLHRSRHDRGRARPHRARSRVGAARGRQRRRRPGRGAGGVSADGAARDALGAARSRGRGPARGADELAGRRVQCVLDTVHDRLLSEASSQQRHRHSSCGSAAAATTVMVWSDCSGFR